MKRSKRGSIALGGLTPLLDTLFLLLFALLALSESRAGAPAEEITVELPRVEPGDAAQAHSARPVVRLDVDAGGVVRLSPGGEVLRDRAALDRALGAALGGEAAVPEDVIIELRADRVAPHGVAVELLQHLRLAGFVDVRLLAEAEPRPDQPFGGGPR